MELDPAILEYYARGNEADRLLGGFPSGPLELARTQELILRHLPEDPLEVLDVGGGPGVYASWLAEQGHRVRLVDPLPLHVEQAKASHPEVTAELGDARQLHNHEDASVDVVLLLGPLYHLMDRPDRLQALEEARRVLRAGGMLFAAAISRFAALLDLLVRLDRLHEPDVFRAAADAIATGEFHGAEAGLFTNAYFHRPRELENELADAGFERVEVFNIEGPGFLVPDFPERWEDPDRREAIMRSARLVESDPDLLATASHLLAVGRSQVHS